MKKNFSFPVLLLVFLSGTIYADDLPTDSSVLLGKFAAYEEKELKEARARVAEKKAMVITALKAHFKRESDSGNRESALAILTKIETLDGGKRRLTQGLDKMVPFAEKTPRKPLGRADIPDGAVRVGSSSFLLFTDRVTRSEASERCKKIGGRLAVIKSKRVYENYVDEARQKYTFNASWTGGRFDKVTKGWVWDDDKTRFGTKFLLEKSDASKPQYEFLVMDMGSGKLFPKPDFHKQCFLCEWPH